MAPRLRSSTPLSTPDREKARVHCYNVYSRARLITLYDDAYRGYYSGKICRGGTEVPVKIMCDEGEKLIEKYMGIIQ